jgi:hypothetical protein
MSMIKLHIHYFNIPALLSIIFLSGCQALWEPGSDFGSSVNDAIRTQVVNPDKPAKTPINPTGLDGPAAKASIDNYHYSFEQRPATPNGAGGASGYGGMVIGSPSSSQSLGVTR